MAYRPPTKSPYGDTELSDDTWSANTLPPPPLTDQPPTHYSQGNFGGYQSSLPVSQNQSQVYNATPANSSRFNQAQGGHQNLGTELKNQMQSLTPEDILFMRSWQRDSFLYRVVPLSLLGFGALYMYNKHKNLPFKIGRYVMVGIGCHFLGKWSYGSEFKRRLAETRSNTPYIQTLRRTFGIQPIVANDGFFSDPNTGGYGSSPGNDSTNWSDPNSNFSPNGPQIGRSSFAPPSTPTPSYIPEQSNQPPFESSSFDNNSNEASKPATTYEELRARNRGIIK